MGPRYPWPPFSASSLPFGFGYWAASVSRRPQLPFRRRTMPPHLPWPVSWSTRARREPCDERRPSNVGRPAQCQPRAGVDERGDRGRLRGLAEAAQAPRRRGSARRRRARLAGLPRRPRPAKASPLPPSAGSSCRPSRRRERAIAAARTPDQLRPEDHARNLPSRLLTGFRGQPKKPLRRLMARAPWRTRRPPPFLPCRGFHRRGASRGSPQTGVGGLMTDASDWRVVYRAARPWTTLRSWPSGIPVRMEKGLSPSVSIR